MNSTDVLHFIRYTKPEIQKAIRRYERMLEEDNLTPAEITLFTNRIHWLCEQLEEMD